MTGLIDPQFPQRVACCILESAAAILEDHGIPEPDRVEHVAHRFDVFPGCCSALLLRVQSITNTTTGDNDCGLHQAEIRWSLQYTDCMTVRAPDETCEVESGDCRSVLRCPPTDTPHVFDDSPCAAKTKAQETDQISSAMWALTSLLATEVKACLCDPASVPYPTECVEQCGPTAACQYVRLQQVTAVDGGGCFGFNLELRTRHMLT